MQGEIVAQGVELMLYGMGTVVLFLALLVVATTAMSQFVGRYFPEPEPTAMAALQRLRGQGATAAESGQSDAEVVAAISTAIHRYRANRK